MNRTDAATARIGDLVRYGSGRRALKYQITGIDLNHDDGPRFEIRIADPAMTTARPFWVSIEDCEPLWDQDKRE